MFMCRRMNSHVFFVRRQPNRTRSPRSMNGTDAEGAEISHIRDFMVDLRLNDKKAIWSWQNSVKFAAIPFASTAYTLACSRP
jgi:hypothetical protein